MWAIPASQRRAAGRRWFKACSKRNESERAGSTPCCDVRFFKTRRARNPSAAALLQKLTKSTFANSHRNSSLPHSLSQLFTTSFVQPAVYTDMYYNVQAGAQLAPETDCQTMHAARKSLTCSHFWKGSRECNTPLLFCIGPGHPYRK